MADIHKKLYGGTLTATTTKLYTTPSGKRTVLKSLTVCNTSSSEQTFYIDVNGFYFCWLRKIKPYETLVIPVFDQVLTAGQSISMSSTSQSANTLIVRLSGKETDRSDLLSARLKLTNTTEVNILSSSSQTLLIKSIAICTHASSPIDFFMRLGDDYVIYAKALRQLDTLFIPIFDHILNPGELTNCRVSNTATNVTVHVNAMVVS